jgi:FlaA1/EpsC-like NDP-sugar epimerase
MTTPDSSATPFARDLAPTNLSGGVVLVGTLDTLSTLAPQFAFAAGLTKPMGCFVLDHPAGGASLPPSICGITILGDLVSLPAVHTAQPISLALVCLAAAQTDLRQQVARTLRDLSIDRRDVVSLRDVLNLPAAVRQGGIDWSALIGRVPHTLDEPAVTRALHNKRVLITGAGGSIGGELALLAASFQPESIILVERSENALFEIDRKIARLFPNLRRESVLLDVVHAEHTRRLFMHHQPHAVFHAAAHKHVPLMEDHPAQAMHNNVSGTMNVAQAAIDSGAERFVLISSDKAVRPSSVMGATKRLAEIYVQSLGEKAAQRGCRLCAVRFGNVLGSACSVLPIWSAQLAEGGPLTVTDPRMTRYFMTINEAATLVIQTSAFETTPAAPSIFVLDMGQPVRILDLADRFLRMQGYTPHVQDQTQLSTSPSPGSVGIVFTGARPGEKLDELLSYELETLAQTPHPGIRSLTVDEPPTAADGERIRQALSQISFDTPRADILALLRELIPSMTAPVTSTTGENSNQSTNKPFPFSAKAA